MIRVLAVVSLLHEDPDRAGSAARLFRDEPVLSWTLRRIALAQRVSSATILCWDDQQADASMVAHDHRAQVVSLGPRQTTPIMQAMAASLRWADGWRGAVLGATPFDAGFHPRALLDLLGTQQADAALLVDPAAALVDPALLDQLVLHAENTPAAYYTFMPTAPGTSGLLLRKAAIEELAGSGSFPGRLLNYWPDLPGRDPIALDPCAPYPTPLARTLHRFLLDSKRQVEQFDRSTSDLNGQLIRTPAETLLGRLGPVAHRFPREVVLELTPRRAVPAAHYAATHLQLERPDFSLDHTRALFDELAGCDDLRLTFAGAGDPLLHPQAAEIIAAAQKAGIPAIAVETDLIDIPHEIVVRLAETAVDLIAVQIPAASAEVYRRVMGRDGLSQVLGTMQTLLRRLGELGKATPIVVPVFTKLQENLAEMESWYDHWLRTLGCAVIRGASDCAGQIPEASPVDMTPPKRRSCHRLDWRLTVLSDGRVVPCENDVAGRQSLGRLGTNRIADLWGGPMQTLRRAHSSGELPPLCTACRDWHRP